jgi:hypothetical protein
MVTTHRPDSLIVCDAERSAQARALRHGGREAMPATRSPLRRSTHWLIALKRDAGAASDDSGSGRERLSWSNGSWRGRLRVTSSIQTRVVRPTRFVQSPADRIPGSSVSSPRSMAGSSASSPFAGVLRCTSCDDPFGSEICLRRKMQAATISDGRCLQQLPAVDWRLGASRMDDCVLLSLEPQRAASQPVSQIPELAGPSTV